MERPAGVHRMTLYDTLGIPPSASADTINHAYRRAARRSHPDKGGSKSAFQRVERAGRILRDPQRRLAYDQTGQPGEACDDAPLTDEQHAVNLMKLLFIKILDHCMINGGSPLYLLEVEVRKGIRE